MRRNKRNRQPDESVCDTQHTVHSDELFVISNTKETVSQINVCGIYGMRFTWPCRQCVTSVRSPLASSLTCGPIPTCQGDDGECFCTISERTCRLGRLFVYRGKLATVHRLFAFPSRFGTAVARSSSLLHLPSPFLLPFLIIFSMEGTSQKRPRYSCPDLKDDVVEELIDRCDVITSASMAGSFKTILDSTNNIITRNPRVQERFDLPYLLPISLFAWARTMEASPCAS